MSSAWFYREKRLFYRYYFKKCYHILKGFNHYVFVQPLSYDVQKVKKEWQILCFTTPLTVQLLPLIDIAPFVLFFYHMQKIRKIDNLRLIYRDRPDNMKLCCDVLPQITLNKVLM
jgi:hypothetical protein